MNLSKRKIRIGCGAGFSGDRIEPAVELARYGEIDYLVFECLAERTIALAQQAKLADPTNGYDPLLVDRMIAVLPTCQQKGIRIITNMGAANPMAAGKKIQEVAGDLGLTGLKVAVVLGDDVLEVLVKENSFVEELGCPVSALGKRLLSANAYLGADAIVDALKGGAEVVVTGRVADAALFLAPLIYEFGWAMDDWKLLGKGTVVGHLLECAGQITGGYFADPDLKDVSGLARLGFPIAEVSEDGSAIITKVEGSGGEVTVATCTEQLLYEIHDPTNYLTPDVVADFSSVATREIGNDRVQIEGGSGLPRPDHLKVSIGYLDGYIGEGQISYVGPGAVKRGRLAIEIIKQRLKLIGAEYADLRCELIGVDAIHKSQSTEHEEPYEVRVRVAGLAKTMKEAVRIGNEVEALYTNGPAAGGGVTKSSRQVVALASVLLPRALAVPKVCFFELPRTVSDNGVAVQDIYHKA
jgi:hypothetical protein